MARAGTIFDNMGRGDLGALVAGGDSPDHRALFDALQRCGFDVLEAADGPEALEVATRERVRLVFIGQQLTGLDGLELCRRLSAAPAGRHVHVILLLASTDRQGVAAGLEAGAGDILSSPVEPAEVLARLATATRILHLEDRHQRQQRRLEQLSRTLADRALVDPLMGIGNRRSFEQTIGKAHVNARKHRIAYGVLMADVDRFKAFNDRYGHQAGDSVLERVARAMRKALRGGDSLFRYGGEELVLVTRSCRGATLDALGERLRAAVEGLGIPHEGSDSGMVTCSFGGALFDPLEEPTAMAWQQVVERADGALYEAKEGGRNRVVLWKES